MWRQGRLDIKYNSFQFIAICANAFYSCFFFYLPQITLLESSLGVIPPICTTQPCHSPGQTFPSTDWRQVCVCVHMHAHTHTNIQNHMHMHTHAIIGCHSEWVFLAEHTTVFRLFWFCLLFAWDFGLTCNILFADRLTVWKLFWPDFCTEIWICLLSLSNKHIHQQ